MKVDFCAIEEFKPGQRWQYHFERLYPAYSKWFLREGDEARPAYLSCVRALREHMPELLATYEQLVDLAGGGDRVARLLSLYCPAPYLTGCSQAVWTRGQPLLVRNYDYVPRLWDAALWHSAWNNRRVISMVDCLWGVLDGMNENGLAVSLSFGGRKVVGRGFGIPLVLRYVLEFCDATAEAVKVLKRIPCHMAYNVTILDARGDHATVYLAPDRPPEVTNRAVATNHQRGIEWRQFAHATASVDRERYLIMRRSDEHECADRFIQRFLQPPIFWRAFEQGWGTLYTAIYHPTRGQSCYRWPEHQLNQSFENFKELQLQLTYC